MSQSIDTSKLSPEQRRELLVLLERRVCRSLADFTRAAWPIIEPGTPLAWNWHLDVIAAYLQAFYEGRITRLILNVPPGSMKSIMTAVMGPAWCWTWRPAARIVSLTNEQGLAVRDNRRMRQVIESDWYQRLWPLWMSGDQREKTYFENTRRGFRQGLGMGGNITGKRGDFLVLDDPIDASKAFSDVEIANCNQTYDQAVSTRLNNPANDGICLIMQRLRTNDLTGHLLGKKETAWTHVRIPMEWDGERGYDPAADLGAEYAHLKDPREKRGELFFEQRFSAKTVKAMREDLGEYGYAGQGQQRPSPLSGGILKTAHWRVWPDDKKLPKIAHCYASWDTAYSERDFEDAAYSACTVWGVWLDERDCSDANPEGRHKLLLLSSWWGRVDFDDLIRRAHIVQGRKLKRPSDAHLIEAKASGLSMIQSLRRKRQLRILGYDPKRDGGGDKVARAYMIQPLLSAGICWIPNKEWAHETVKIVSEFPAGGPPCADVTDTVTQAIRYLDRGWWINHPDDDWQPADSDIDLDEDDERPQRKMAVYG